jgi:hypothetical protein
MLFVDLRVCIINPGWEPYEAALPYGFVQGILYRVFGAVIWHIEM